MKINSLISNITWLTFRAPDSAVSPYILTTGQPFGSLLSAACFSTRTRPHPSPSDCLRPIWNQTFSRKNTNNLIPIILPAYTAYEDVTEDERKV